MSTPAYALYSCLHAHVPRYSQEEAERRRLEAEEAAKYVSPYGADHDTLVNKDTFKLWNDMFLAVSSQSGGCTICRIGACT